MGLVSALRVAWTGVLLALVMGAVGAGVFVMILAMLVWIP